MSKNTVMEIQKFHLDNNDSFIVKLSKSNANPNDVLSFMTNFRKMLPAEWKGVLICLGADESVEKLTLPAARELFLKLKDYLDRYTIGNTVAIGQVWEACDPRKNKSRLEILEAADQHVIVKYLNTGIKTRIRIDRLKAGSRGYRLVQT